MRLHQDTNKPDRQLLLNDIEGSQPRNKWLFRTNRSVNPLEPSYTLPSFVAAPTVTSKFTRDSYDVSDIEGTKSRPLYPLAQRQNHLVDDIDGAQSGWKPRHLRARREAPPLDYSLNVRDITGGGFRTRRTTNPLIPSYRVNGMDIADDPIKTKPRGLPKAKTSPFYPLITLDIEGAQPGWRPLPQMNPPLEARRHFRNTNYMGDIPGAQADTVKHSIVTDRHVNPLNPVYASLDGEPLANPQTPLYKERAWIEAEAQVDKTIAAEELANSSVSANAVPSCEKSPLNEEKSTGGTSKLSASEERHKRSECSTPQRPSSEPLQSGPRDDVSDSTEGRGAEGGRIVGRAQDNRMISSARTSSSGDNKNARNDSKEKDKRIRQLEDEVRLLWKISGQAWQRKSQSKLIGDSSRSNGSTDGQASVHSWPGFSSDQRQQLVHTANKLSKPPYNNTEKLHPFSVTSSGGMPPRTKVPRSAGGVASRQPNGKSRSANDGDETCWPSGGEGGAMMIRSCGEQGVQAERLVLRSANGTPRVSLTPSERRSAREYSDEVSSVHDLL